MGVDGDRSRRQLQNALPAARAADEFQKLRTEARLSGFGWAGSRTSFEELAQARLVKITDWRFAGWLDPFGMLPSQVVVNLLLKLGHGVDRVADPR